VFAKLSTTASAAVSSVKSVAMADRVSPAARDVLACPAGHLVTLLTGGLEARPF
jgi:hypothetical protein